MASLQDRLKAFLNIDAKKVNGVPTITPTVAKKQPSGKIKFEPVEYTPEIEKMYKYYLNQCTINKQDVEKRERRNKLLRQMYYENTIIYLAVEMLADESINTQDSEFFITVESKNKRFNKKIYELFDKWEVNKNTAKSQFQSLYLYGDAFRYRKISEKDGITGFNYLDVDDIKNRYEFNPLKINDFNDSFQRLTQNYNSINTLYNTIAGDNYADLSNMLDSYLLGWELSVGMVLPPWAISHARLYSSESEFFPFGRSLFINSLSAFLQLKASKNLMVMARANNFPTEVYKLKDNENQTETEKWNALNKFVQNLQNLTSTSSTVNEKGIKDTIFSMEGLFSYEQIKPDFNLDEIADIEMLEMDLLRPTGIPLDLILGRGGSFSSGKLLSTQNLFFQRKVVSGKSAYLESLVEDIKLHLTLINDSDKDEDFELQMYAPQAEQEDDYFNSRKNTLDLIDSIIESVKKAIGLDVDVDLPIKVVKDIFKQYSFLNVKEIDKLIDAMYQGKEKAVDVMGGEEDFFYANNDIDSGKIDPVDSFGNTQSDKEEPDPEDDVTDENFKKLKRYENSKVTRNIC
jgi:hypothetical protein